MKENAKFAALAGVALTGMALAALLVPTSEAGAGKPPTNVPLTASFRQAITDPATLPDPLPTDRILGDDKGAYLSGITGSGVCDLHLYNPSYRTGGNLFIYIDNAGNTELGRALNFLFYERTFSCGIDDVPDSPYPPEFPVGTGTLPVMTRWVQLKTWYLFLEDPVDHLYKESTQVLNLAKMGVEGNPTLAYVGMSIEFGYLQDSDPADVHQVGFRWDPIEVEALTVGPNGATEWAIRPIQSQDVYSKIVATTPKLYLPSRMLSQIDYLRKGYKAYCYGFYGMPFELHLDRM